MRWLARLLHRQVFEDQERYHRLLSAILEARAGVGYDYPTISLVTEWLLGQVDESRYSVAELHQRLRRSVGTDEADELCGRLQAALNNYSQQSGAKH